MLSVACWWLLSLFGNCRLLCVVCGLLLFWCLLFVVCLVLLLFVVCCLVSVVGYRLLLRVVYWLAFVDACLLFVVCVTVVAVCCMVLLL